MQLEMSIISNKLSKTVFDMLSYEIRLKELVQLGANDYRLLVQLLTVFPFCFLLEMEQSTASMECVGIWRYRLH